MLVSESVKIGQNTQWENVPGPKTEEIAQPGKVEDPPVYIERVQEGD